MFQDNFGQTAEVHMTNPSLMLFVMLIQRDIARLNNIEINCISKQIRKNLTN